MLGLVLVQSGGVSVILFYFILFRTSLRSQAPSQARCHELTSPRSLRTHHRDRSIEVQTNGLECNFFCISSLSLGGLRSRRHCVSSAIQMSVLQPKPYRDTVATFETVQHR
jgi:hypothetical protein